MRYRVEHSKINFISPRAHALFNAKLLLPCHFPKNFINFNRLFDLNINLHLYNLSFESLFRFIYVDVWTINNIFYYMAGSASGQDEANSVFRLATRAGKIGPSCPLGIARFGPANKRLLGAGLRSLLTLQNETVYKTVIITSV